MVYLLNRNCLNEFWTLNIKTPEHPLDTQGLKLIEISRPRVVADNTGLC